MHNNQQSTINNSALSLILTLLIISSILTGTVLVGDIIIRHSRTVKGTEISEIAYFAAETAIEKAAYHVLKNYADISTCAIPLTTLPDSGGKYEMNGTCFDVSGGKGCVAIDDDCPNVPTECSAGNISNTNAWSITLSAGESFQLDLDIDGATYPTGLLIERVGGSEPSDLIIYSCTTTGSFHCTDGGTPRECSSGYSQDFDVSFEPPDNNLNTSSYASKYWKIRINNNGSVNQIYRITPGNNTLPVGIDISATGTYSDYERKLKTNFPKWQIFGS